MHHPRCWSEDGAFRVPYKSSGVAAARPGPFRRPAPTAWAFALSSWTTALFALTASLARAAGLGTCGAPFRSTRLSASTFPTRGRSAVLAGAGASARTATTFGLGASPVLAFAASLTRTAGFGTCGAPFFSTRFTAPVLSFVTTSTSEPRFAAAMLATTGTMSAFRFRSTATRLTALATAMLAFSASTMGLFATASMTFATTTMGLFATASMTFATTTMGLFVSAAMLGSAVTVVGRMAAAVAVVVRRAVPAIGVFAFASPASGVLATSVVFAIAVRVATGRGVVPPAAPVVVLVIALGFRRRYAGREQTTQRQQGRQEGRPPWSDH